jgi:hypothetical protein
MKQTAATYLALLALAVSPPTVAGILAAAGFSAVLLSVVKKSKAHPCKRAEMP